MNSVFMIGRLVAEPEAASTSSGIACCRFRIAVDRSYKDKDGNTQTDFIPVTAWRGLADLCNRYLSKGKQVAVKGELHTSTYTNKDGEKKYSWNITADQVKFLTPKAAGEAREDAPPVFDDEAPLPF